MHQHGFLEQVNILFYANIIFVYLLSRRKGKDDDEEGM
jgi:hypothetical protein